MHILILILTSSKWHISFLIEKCFPMIFVLLFSVKTTDLITDWVYQVKEIKKEERLFVGWLHFGDCLLYLYQSWLLTFQSLLKEPYRAYIEPIVCLIWLECRIQA